MRIPSMVVATTLLFLIANPVLGQNGNPFGGGQDPFGSGGAAADPFGGDDPFGSGAPRNKPAAAASDDPFAPGPARAKPTAAVDPFAPGPARAKPTAAVDPFAPGPATTRPAATAKTRNKQRRVNPAPQGYLQYLKSETASGVAARRIRAGLSDETTQTFIQLPLEDAVRQLSETHDLPIVIDRRALEEIGLSTDQPVTLSLKNVTLRSFLRLMLRDLDLTYMVKDEVMQITTIQAAEQNLQLEAYPFPEALAPKADKVVAALTTSVHPAVWSTAGGPSSVSVVDNVLVVSATEHVHEDVQEFLQKLDAAYKARLAKQ